MSSMTPAKRHKPCSHYCLRADRAKSLRPSLDPCSPILRIFLEPYHEPWRIRAGEFQISRYQALKNKMKSLYQTKWGRCTWQRFFLCWNITRPNVPVKLWFNYLGPYASYNHLSLATMLASVYTSVRNASLAEARGEEDFYGAMASV